MVHFVNLTRGLLCDTKPTPYYHTRIQSTWCEQKRWSDVLFSLSPDLLMWAAKGETCIIHDQSELPRETRAQWQGLSWIRFACTKAWYNHARIEFSRNGMNVTEYWLEQYEQLPKPVIRNLEYYRQYAASDTVEIHPCTCPKLGLDAISESVDNAA